MAENDIRVTFTEEEMGFVKGKGRGFLRGLVQECMAGGMDSGKGSVEWAVHLTPEQSEYVRKQEEKNGTGWFGRVAEINMAAVERGLPPFYWLLPEGVETVEAE
jgi:hypothetical protein